MNYTLHIRAFFDTTSTDDATRFAAQTFPELPVAVVGPYWKIETLIEVELHHAVTYRDDAVAYDETLAYFQRITPDWTLLGPDVDRVIDGMIATPCGDHMTWGHFELCRFHSEPRFASYEKVLVTTRDAKLADVNGLLAAVLGRAQNDDGSWGYAVHVYDHEITYSVAESDLTSTGEHGVRSDFCSGGSISVSRDGEITGQSRRTT